MLFKDTSGQISAELILLLAGMIIIVIIATSMYKNYIIDFANEINNNEISNLNNKIDKITDLLKD